MNENTGFMEHAMGDELRKMGKKNKTILSSRLDMGMEVEGRVSL